MKSMPLVSIVTPVFNGGKYIVECIESVLSQSYSNIEHVIVDGGSTDNTIEILTAYSTKYPQRFRIDLKPDSLPGSGPGEAWNRCLQIAQGTILGWLGNDDTLFDTNSIDQVASFFRENPNAYFVHGSCNVINEHGELLAIHRARPCSLDQLLNQRNYISFPSAFYRKKVVEVVGGLDGYGNDYDYVIRIAKQFQLYYIDATLSTFRVHVNSETGSRKNFKRLRKMDHTVARFHGAKMFSKRSAKYYIGLASDWLPDLIYYPLRKILGKKIIRR